MALKNVVKRTCFDFWPWARALTLSNQPVTAASLDHPLTMCGRSLCSWSKCSLKPHLLWSIEPNSKETWSRLLPCLLQDTRGFGWPSAIHSITAGRPSMTVVLRGGATITTLFGFVVSSGRRQSETGKSFRQTSRAHWLVLPPPPTPQFMFSESQRCLLVANPSNRNSFRCHWWGSCSIKDTTRVHVCFEGFLLRSRNTKKMLQTVFFR